jgi:hypothetical protein
VPDNGFDTWRGDDGQQLTLVNWKCVCSASVWVPGSAAWPEEAEILYFPDSTALGDPFDHFDHFDHFGGRPYLFGVKTSPSFWNRFYCKGPSKVGSYPLS